MQANDRTEHALRLLGLAARARRVTVGVPLICAGLQKSKQSMLVLVAADASDNTQKRISDKCTYYGVQLIRLSADCERLALSVGKRDGAVAAVGVTEPNLAAAISKLFEE